ncbi:hypothetical protein ACFO8M_08950 [Glycomyces rhizosphaerae]|uniref:Uncharacterized protein n=1 Tax=Glycomyces rhizosphaerae TaxID=2054422 RepID=A0ABV7PYL9_9ACTN
MSGEVGQYGAVPVGPIAEEFSGQSQLQAHAVDAMAAAVDGRVVPPGAGSLAFPPVVVTGLLQGAEAESDAVELVAGEVLTRDLDPLRWGRARQMRQCRGDRVDVGSPIEEQVYVTDRQVDPLQAGRPGPHQAMPEPGSDRRDQVEAFAQHCFEVAPVAQRAGVDLNHGREYARRVRHGRLSPRTAGEGRPLRATSLRCCGFGHGRCQVSSIQSAM